MRTLSVHRLVGLRSPVGAALLGEAYRRFVHATSRYEGRSQRQVRRLPQCGDDVSRETRLMRRRSDGTGSRDLWSWRERQIEPTMLQSPACAAVRGPAPGSGRGASEGVVSSPQYDALGLRAAPDPANDPSPTWTERRQQETRTEALLWRESPRALRT
jgi:hypothetical protein